MQRSKGARILPLFIVTLVIILIIAGVVSLVRALTGSDEATQVNEDANPGRTQLLDTSDTSSVLMTVRGPIVAEEEHRSYQVRVKPDSRRMTVYKGYVGTELRSKGLSNNKEAYAEFVNALDKANMMVGEVPADDEKNDLKGICATGYTYEYSVFTSDAQVKRLWASTCDGSKGSLDASVTQLNNLFLAQIPDSNELIPFNNSRFQLRF